MYFKNFPFVSVTNSSSHLSVVALEPMLPSSVFVGRGHGIAVAEPGKSNEEGQTLLNLVEEGQSIKILGFNSKKICVYTSISLKPVTLGGPGPLLVPLSLPLMTILGIVKGK